MPYTVQSITEFEDLISNNSHQARPIGSMYDGEIHKIKSTTDDIRGILNLNKFKVKYLKNINV